MKTYTQKEHKKVLELYRKKNTVISISRQTGISRNTIYRWVEESQLGSVLAEKNNQREIIDLRKKVERLELIVEILQKTSCSTHSSIAEKCKEIESLSDQYSETQMCNALKLPKGTYFNYKNRGKHGLTSYALKRQELTPIIEEIFQQSKGVYGAPKVCAILKERGYKTSPEYVAGIMHENGWFSSRGGAKRKYINQTKKTNILNRHFNVSRPNEVWVGDITYFKVDGRTIYLCAIIDLYARKVVGYRFSDKNSTQLTKRTFREAFESRNQPAGLIFHSDQGFNYTSRRYQQFLRECGVTQSFSKPGTPYDNSVIESFFKNLKNERLYITNPQTKKDYRTEIEWYMNFYNSERPHVTLKYLTPNAAEVSYYSALAKSSEDKQS